MVGFSTIAVSNYPKIAWDKVLSEFLYFDISPLHLSIIPASQVLSMQSIFFGKDIKNASIVKSEHLYIKLKIIFSEVVKLAKSKGIRSLIWGAPSTRTNMEVSREVAFKRAAELIQIAAASNIKLYFEALNNSFCQFLNSHLELIELHELAGVDGIHYDICTALLQNEGHIFLDTYEKAIERYHLSEDGYKLTVLDNLTALSINKRLQDLNIRGTLEVQDFTSITTSDLLKALQKININNLDFYE